MQWPQSLFQLLSESYIQVRSVANQFLIFMGGLSRVVARGNRYSHHFTQTFSNLGSAKKKIITQVWLNPFSRRKPP